MVDDNRKINPYELAFGIGRALANEEWQQYFNDFPNTNKPFSAEETKR